MKNTDGEKDYEVDNSMVIPYITVIFFNKYECHINFEYCGSIADIKFIYNYLNKGLDRAYCKIRKINDKGTVQEIADKISTFIHGTYISGTETAWRLQIGRASCRERV